MFQFKHISILGFGVSSIAAVEFFLKNSPEIKIRVSELKERDLFAKSEPKIGSFEAQGVEFEFGKQTEEFIGFNSSSELLFIMISPGIPPRSPVIKLIEKLSRNDNVELGTDLDIFADQVRENYIGITGTNGKTTTTSLVAEILGNQAIGNIGKPFLEYESAGKGLDDFYACEVSSFQLYYSQLENLPKVSIYLNFSDDHLDWHKDLQEYKEAKAELFQVTDEMSNHLVLNYDDEVVNAFDQNWLDEIEQLAMVSDDYTRICFFSVEKELTNLNPVLATSAYIKDETLYLAKYLDEAAEPDMDAIIQTTESGRYYAEIPLVKLDELNLVGKHNYSNILAAVLAADAVGVNLDRIIDTLKTFRPVPHRLEFVGELEGHKCYNDSKATNPDSAIKALEAFDKSIVICGGKNKNLDLSRFIDSLAERAQAVVAIGELKDSLLEELSKKQITNTTKAESMKDALEQALKLGKDNDCPIVLAPASSSFDMFSGYEERGDQFRSLVQKP